ncbi:sulfotransferase [Akkermansiaceae bacterium]|nr:sulfotransferase [Akkermansiaceae bacterium]
MSRIPNFIIGGERRAGSSTMYEVLRMHPEISMYPQRDMDYFIRREMFALQDGDDQHDNNEDWEARHSLEAYGALFEGMSGVVGQKDADLLWWKPAHARLRSFFGDMKFIFILRDPIGRASSQYWNEVRKGRETESFADAINRKLSGATEFQRLHLCYLERGRYIESLQHFYQFFNESNVLVVILENLVANWKEEITRVCQFLEVDPNVEPMWTPLKSNHDPVLTLREDWKGTRKEDWVNFYDRAVGKIIRMTVNDERKKKALTKRFQNIGKVSEREANPMSDETADFLRQYYKPWNEKLENLLSLNLARWGSQ